jgi:D-glycero-alpha-D-manno-heptose-7-phosphate kinase
VIGRRARATVPVRVADVGGWTDTWFGSPGQVCHLAVGPGIEVAVELVDPDVGPLEDPLLQAAVDAVLEPAELDGRVSVRLEVASAVPPGASLGTSASVLVGIVGALDALVGGGRTPAEIARLAHEAETVRAGREAGVQDQWAAALGGAGLLVIGPYPEVRHRALDLPSSTSAELGDRLVTVVFGPHDSSAVHRQVIDAMVTCSGVEHHHARTALSTLSSLAGQAAEALEAGDLGRWGEVLLASVDAQAALHPDLVGAPHRAAIEVARAAGAVAWKVNGAGGDGGSLSVLSGEDEVAADRLAADLAAADPRWAVLRQSPAPGLRVEV